MKAAVILVLLGAAMATAADWQFDKPDWDFFDSKSDWASEAKPAPKPKPKPCCTPDQWEGKLGSGGGVLYRRKPRGFAELVGLSYDFKNKRVAMSQTRYYGKKVVKDKVIVDHKKKVLYFIIKDKCYKKTLKKDMRKMCVPANATFQGDLVFGLKPNTLAAQSWGATFKSRHPPMYFHMSVTMLKGCIPMGENVMGMRFTRHGPMYITMSSGFFDISAGIKDPKVFTPPKSCSAYEEEFGEEPVNTKYHGFSDEMGDAYQRFVELL